MITIPNRPTTTLPELQRDVIAVVGALGPAAEAKQILGVSVATSETPVAHGLRGVPSAFYVQQLASGGPVYRSSNSDSRFIYLRSASGTVACDVLVIP